MHLNLLRTNNFLDWIKSKINYDYHAKTSTNPNIRTIFRGQVYNCDFGVGIGSEYDKVRPCLILQNDSGNNKSPNTIVAPITSYKCPSAISVKIVTAYTYIDYAGNSQSLSGYINLASIVTVSKIRLKDYLVTISDEIDEVESKIFTSLGLYPIIKEYERKIKSQELLLLSLTRKLEQMDKNTLLP